MWDNNELQLKSIRIQITNRHINAKGVWVIHVREFGWDTKDMGIPNDSTQEEAQKRAVIMCVMYVNEMLKQLSVVL